MILKQQRGSSGSRSCLVVWLLRDSLGPPEGCELGNQKAKDLFIYFIANCSNKRFLLWCLKAQGKKKKSLDVLWPSDDVLVLAVPYFIPVHLHWAVGSVPGLSEEIACSKQSHGT